MKKLFIIGLMMLMAFSMIGCGKNEPEEPKEEPAVETEEETAITVSGNTFELTTSYDDDKEVEVPNTKLSFHEDGTFEQESDFEDAVQLTGTYTEDDDYVYITYIFEGESGPEKKIVKDGKTLVYEEDIPEWDENGNETGKTIHTKTIYTLVE